MLTTEPEVPGLCFANTARLVRLFVLHPDIDLKDVSISIGCNVLQRARHSEGRALNGLELEVYYENYDHLPPQRNVDVVQRWRVLLLVLLERSEGKFLRIK